MTSSKTDQQTVVNSALEQAHDWLLHLESADVTNQDRLAFEAWLSEDIRHGDAYTEALSLRNTLERLSVTDLDEDVSAPSRAEKVTAIFDQLSDVLSSRLSLKNVGIPAALTATLVLGIWVQSLNHQQADTPAVAEAVAPPKDYNSAIGEVRTIRLSDNTAVTLGAASSISVLFSASQRTVELNSGEAYFDVEPDPSRPFAVKAQSLTATAIGTAFDVRQTGVRYEVAVSEGIVEVSLPLTIGGNQTAVMQRQALSAGEQIGVSSRGRLLAPESIAIDSVGAWRSHQLIYKGDKLSDLLSDANRYSAIPIEIAPGSEAIGNLKVRGVFLGTDIGRLLETIEQILPVQTYKTQDGKIHLKTKDPSNPSL
ncbi:MAG: FecR family protein [Pseudomonadota bacterium]